MSATPGHTATEAMPIAELVAAVRAAGLPPGMRCPHLPHRPPLGPSRPKVLRRDLAESLIADILRQLPDTVRR